MKFRENMASIRNLSEDHYQNRITFTEYREKRNYFLRLIDEELNQIKFENEDEFINENINESLVDKALSFLKIAK